MHHVNSCKSTYVAESPGSFTCYCGNTGGGTDTEIRVSTESWPWRRRFSRRSCRDSNPRPFNHDSGALTTELFPLPNTLATTVKCRYTLARAVPHHLDPSENIEASVKCHYTLARAVPHHLDPSENTQATLKCCYTLARAVPHHLDPSENTQTTLKCCYTLARSVPHHLDPSENTQATVKYCYTRHRYVGDYLQMW